MFDPARSFLTMHSGSHLIWVPLLYNKNISQREVERARRRPKAVFWRVIKKQTDQWQPTRDIEKYSMDQVSQIIDKTILHTIHHSFTPGSLVAEESNQEHANPSLLVSVKDSFFPALTLLLHRDWLTCLLKGHLNGRNFLSFPRTVITG